MISEEQKVFHVEGNIEGENINLQIAPEAMAHIMTVLTKLYSDDELAIIREYSTNAWDAHIEAGITRPIEVVTPTPLAPFLRIKDYGVGMTVQDIHDIYSRYGASTKRDTNDQVGMLGLGCKSGLAYTNAFTLTAVKDGVKVQTKIARDEDGGGSITIVDTSTTDEENGVEILIPTRRDNGIQRKAESFFSFWPEGTVLLNGAEPKKFEGMKIVDNMWLVDDDTMSNRIVMGNVAYPFDLAGDGWNFSVPGGGYGLVIRVEIGSVAFVPSREALHYTTRTKGVLGELAKTYNEEFPKALQARIDECATHHEALALCQKWSSIVSTTQKFTYQGIPVPVLFSKPPKVIDALLYDGTTTKKKVIQKTMSVSRNPYNKADMTPRPGIPSDWFPKCCWIIGYDQSTWTAHKRTKLDKFREANISNALIYSADIYVLLEDEPTDLIPWINSNSVVKWEDIEAIKIERPKRKRNEDYGAYDVLSTSHSKSRITAKELKNVKDLYYYHGSENGAFPYFDILRNLGETATVVLLGQNRRDKFHRLFPNAVDIAPYVDGLYKSWKDNLSDEDMYDMAMYYHGVYRNFGKMDETKVSDPDVKKAIERSKKIISDQNAVGTIDSNYIKWNAFWTKYNPKTNLKWINPLDKYVLVSVNNFTQNYYDSGTKRIAHSYLYLNTAYARFFKKNKTRARTTTSKKGN